LRPARRIEVAAAQGVFGALHCIKRAGKKPAAFAILLAKASIGVDAWRSASVVAGRIALAVWSLLLTWPRLLAWLLSARLALTLLSLTWLSLTGLLALARLLALSGFLALLALALLALTGLLALLAAAGLVLLGLASA
jgi:hypothetical protein